MSWWRSIRVRITTVATAAVAGVLIATSVALVVVQQRQLGLALDTTLVQRADDIEALVELDPGRESLLATIGDADLVAQIVTPGGVVVAAHPAIADAGPLAAPVTGTDRFFTTSNLSIEDDEFRVLSRGLAGGSTLHVAASRDDVVDATRALIGGLFLIVPVAVAALGMLVWWLVGRTLRPVDTIRSEVDVITAEDIGRRIPTPDVADEIGRLATTMNRMLDRLDTSISAQRQFIADASHELRTPLARMRTQIEVATDEDGPATLASVAEDVAGMQNLVEDLLHLARSDAGARSSRTELVDLDDVVATELRHASSVPEVSITTDLEQAIVEGSASDLGRLVRNLLDNALRHADTAVDVTLRVEPGRAVLRVADDGLGVPAGLHEQIFERFRRIDYARSVDEGGTGLGLAIVRDIARNHDGDVSLDERTTRGAAFLVTLPLASDDWKGG